MDIDRSLDDIINARGPGRGKGRGRTGGRAGGRAPGGRAPGGRAPGGPKGGITKQRNVPSIKKSSSRVVVVGGGGGGGGRRQNNNQQPTCLIGNSTDIKLSAGAVANFLREGKPPVVKAISPVNVNQAVKTLALARNYLSEENVDLYASIDFPEFDDSSNTANVNLYVAQKRQRSDLSKVVAQLQVSASSNIGKVAGAIANNAREAGNPKRICVSCAGPDAMLNALKAIFLARRYLEDDNMDLSVVPEFENVQNGPSLVHLFTLVHAPGATV